MKATRQEEILKLVSEESIQTQDELIARLRQLGYGVTQATVSRDIRQLKLTKVMTEDGVYRYVLPHGSDEGSGATQLNQTLLNAITHIDHVNNTIVIRTYPGMAQAVASGIDAAQDPGILGCVGGDDTIIVIARTDELAHGFCDSFRKQKLVV